jgi:hypothetical protein
MKEVDHRFATTGWLRFTWPILRLLPVGRCRPTLFRLLRHRVVIAIIIVMRALIFGGGALDCLAFFPCFALPRRGTTGPSCLATSAIRRRVDEAINRSLLAKSDPGNRLVSLAEWPHETMVHIFSHVLATRKGLPGARFAERQGLDCRCWWCSACALGFSISILWIQSCEENILDHPHPLPSIHRDAAASSSMYSIPTIR